LEANRIQSSFASSALASHNVANCPMFWPNEVCLWSPCPSKSLLFCDVHSEPIDNSSQA
jgi:hypothetical protein